MGFGEYRRVLALRDVRRVLLLGAVLRVPMWAANVVLTLHVVATLHRSYAAAGLLVACATVALALSNPWRGHRLDRVGLRRTLAPSLVVLTASWAVAPFTGYWPLLVLATAAGAFEVPIFSIVRQSLLHVVPADQRRTALSIDSVVVELSFMVGPVLGVLLATYGSTRWALFGCQFASIAGAALLWLADPPLRHDDDSAAVEPAPPRRSWVGPALVGVLVAATTSTVVLTGTDVSIVAVLRHLGHQGSIGWVMAVWGLGSAVGGVVYGAVHRRIPPPVLLALLAVATLPVVAASGPVVLAALLLPAGFFCAPTITATVDALADCVPERVRGEALGWHGAAMTAGSALGAPLAGLAVDTWGWRGGFAGCAVVGVAGAALGVVLLRGRVRRGDIASHPAPGVDAAVDLAVDPAVGPALVAAVETAPPAG